MATCHFAKAGKKGKDENVAKKKSKKTVKIQRAIVGASLEEVFPSTEYFNLY